MKALVTPTRLNQPALAAARPGAATTWLARLPDYWALTKPEVNLLVVISTLVGYYLGSPMPLRVGRLLHALLGTFLVASGTATLNEFMERDFDALMRRTARRPLPSGRIAPVQALGFGLLLAFAGAVYLWLAVNALASFLAAATLLAYLLLYTPLKRKTPLCTLIGAFPGAVPPLIGWAAARGSLGASAWVLYAIVFLWQFPHFLGIAWVYRDDYARAGYLMLPPEDHLGRSMACQVVVASMALVPVSLVPVWLGQTGWVYFAGGLLLGAGFLYYGVRLAVARTRPAARKVVLASVAYLPLLFVLMMANKK
jgi:protoheme IX farnesyltransferase